MKPPQYRYFLFHGLASGLLAGVASLVYLKIYQFALAVEFSSILNFGSILGASITGGLVASFGCYVFSLTPFNKEWIFNVVFTVLTFLSLVGPLSFKLPLQIESPELFLGATVPMHFNVQLLWLSTKPMFCQRKI